MTNARRKSPKKTNPNLDETRFLFLGTKVLDEMKILARLAAKSEKPSGETS